LAEQGRRSRTIQVKVKRTPLQITSVGYLKSSQPLRIVTPCHLQVSENDIYSGLSLLAAVERAGFTADEAAEMIIDEGDDRLKREAEDGLKFVAEILRQVASRREAATSDPEGSPDDR
jgi:hypothetical protein